MTDKIQQARRAAFDSALSIKIVGSGRYAIESTNLGIKVK